MTKLNVPPLVGGKDTALVDGQPALAVNLAQSATIVLREV